MASSSSSMTGNPQSIRGTASTCEKVSTGSYSYGQVLPYLLFNVVPDMNATSHTTSIFFVLSPITTPFAARGTPPESCTIVTLSPSAKRWFCNL